MDRQAVTPGEVVVDSSALIGLEQIGHLDLLRLLFGGVTVPPAVAQESAPTVSLPNWIRVKPLVDIVPVDLLRTGLGQGERECIALALTLDVEWIVLDELRARRLALARGLPVTGVLGVLRLARFAGHVELIGPAITALRESGFFVGDALVMALLAEFGEI